MGFFDFFRRKPKPLAPDELKRQLQQAVQVNDLQRLAALCNSHQDQIVSTFSDWQKPPLEMAEDRPVLEKYVQFLATVAEYFSKYLQRPELWQKLTGAGNQNVLLEWDQKFRQVEALWEKHKYKDAIVLLTDHLIAVRYLKGTGVDAYLPKTYGHLGYSYFQSGQAEKSIAPFDKALELCIEHGDTKGALAYLGNLYEAHRVLGEAARAAGCAERMAECNVSLGREVEAGWHRKQAAVQRAGEPLNRMVAAIGGRQYELEDLPRLPEGERVQFQFYRNRTSLRQALSLTAQAEALATKGDFDLALQAFQAAAQADPCDPQPHYEAGVTLLHLKRFAEAAEQFQITEKLAPGWFLCRRYLRLAEQLALGKWDHGLFLALQVEEDQESKPEAKLRVLEKGVERYPGVAWLLLATGVQRKVLGQIADAEAAFRKGLTCVEDADIKTCLLFELANVLDSKVPERKQLLEEAAVLGGNLLAAAASKMLLKNMASDTARP